MGQETSIHERRFRGVIQVTGRDRTKKKWLLLLGISYCLLVACDPILNESEYKIIIGIYPPTADPTFSPGGGVLGTALDVTITCKTPGAFIRYTTDGITTPTESIGTLYSGPISVTTSGIVIKAIAFKPGIPDSSVVTASYLISYWKAFGTSGNGAGQFFNPTHITLDGGYLYIADCYNNRIVKMSDMNGSGWTVFGSLGSGTNQLNHPMGLGANSSGKIFVADAGNHRLVQIDDMSGSGWTAYGIGSGIPTGVDFDTSGRIYFTDREWDHIKRMNDMSGTGLTDYGGFMVLYSPNQVTLDSSGHIYITDTGHDRIIRIDDMSGNGFVAFGSSGSGDRQFDCPSDITVDGSGRIYIADGFNGRIVRIDDMSGANWTTFGSTGTGDNEFRMPSSVVVDPAGRLYVTDANNDRIVSFIIP
jgi:sugar lactone lactonase YvrE